MQTETYRAVPWERKLSERQFFFHKVLQLKLSLQATQISFFPKKRLQTPFAVKALPCVFQKGSLTVEASMVLPVFLIAMLTVFSFLPAYARQMETTQKLLETAEKAAIYRAMGTEAADGGYDGTLTKVYRYVPKVHLPGVGAMWLTAQVKVRPWIGYDGDLGSDGETADSQLVYISDNKEVYHTSPDCSYLDIHLISMNTGQVKQARNHDGHRYTACEKCCHGHMGSVVYVSENGEHYHSSTSCSGLSRSPEAVLYSEVGALPLCSRCKMGHN